MSKGKVALKNREGEVNINYQGYEMIIIKYTSNVDIDIRFLNNGSTRFNKGYKEFKKGNIKNLYHPEICNVGFCGDGKYNATHHSKCYDVWRSMIRRCYNKNGEHYKYYKDVTVCGEWHNFQNFAKWFEENYNSEIMKGWQLDKDILVKGNKTYSPKTCCFVPQEVNKLFTKRDCERGNYPIGVCKIKTNKYSVQFTQNSKNIRFGIFSTPEEAFQVYKEAKEQYIKEIADKWKNLIDPEVYEAMYNYKVEITD